MQTPERIETEKTEVEVGSAFCEVPRAKVAGAVSTAEGVYKSYMTDAARNRPKRFAAEQSKTFLIHHFSKRSEEMFFAVNSYLPPPRSLVRP